MKKLIISALVLLIIVLGNTSCNNETTKEDAIDHLDKICQYALPASKEYQAFGDVFFNVINEALLKMTADEYIIVLNQENYNKVNKSFNDAIATLKKTVESLEQIDNIDDPFNLKQEYANYYKTLIKNSNTNLKPIISDFNKDGFDSSDAAKLDAIINDFEQVQENGTKIFDIIRDYMDHFAFTKEDIDYFATTYPF